MFFFQSLSLYSKIYIYTLIKYSFFIPLTFVSYHTAMKIVSCDYQYAAQILAIFNEAIQNSTALYDYYPRTMQMMADWFEHKRKGNYPVIGLINDNNELLAFGTYGMFRERPAYKYTVEHSLYVHTDHRGHGYGKQILAEIIQAAKRDNYHCLVAGIDAKNEVSKKLHAAFGFKHYGHLPEVGFKFGEWLDLDFYQLILDTPLHPQDG